MAHKVEKLGFLNFLVSEANLRKEPLHATTSHHTACWSPIAMTFSNV